MNIANHNFYTPLKSLAGRSPIHGDERTCSWNPNPRPAAAETFRRLNNARYPVLGLLLAAFILLGCGSSKAEEKITIGPVEEVVLLPWGIKLLARIDTGANTSSLGARDLNINNNVAEFRIRPEYGGHNMKVPIVEWRGFRAGGSHELRPVIEAEICLGTKRIRTQLNLNDRSSVAYPLLIGRRVLRGRFIVDVSRRERLTPNCPEVKSP